MSDKPILDIALDTSAFDAFRAKFDAYRAKLEETPSQWAEAGKTTATMTAQFSALVDKMAAMQAALAKLEQDQDQATVDQSTAADSWSRIAESGKKFAGDVKGATLSLTRWAGLSGLFSAILAGGGLYGISRMASGVASRRSGAMSYGLSYGEYQAYQNSFARLGNADGMLSGFNDAMTRADARAPLYALMGQNADRRLAGKDAAGALAEALPDIKRLADQTDPRNMEGVVHALGVDKIGVTGDVLRTARRMSPQEINEIAAGYQNNIGPMGLAPEMALKWQAFTTAMDEAGAEIENHFAINLGNLAPGLTRLSDAVAATVDVMLKDGGAASKWLARVNKGITEFADEIATPQFLSKVDSFVKNVGEVGRYIGQIIALHDKPRNPDASLSGKVPNDPSQRKGNRWLNWLFGVGHHSRPSAGGGMTGLRPKAAQKRADAAASGVQTPDQSVLAPNTGASQQNRPRHIGGWITIGGERFHFGSGGAGRGSIPYGDYPITPGAIGSWGAAHGALGINNNAIWDAKLGSTRRGIEFHAGMSDALITQGCMAIAGREWPRFKALVMEMIRKNGRAYLHVGANGASVTSEPTHHSREAAPSPPTRTAPRIDADQPKPKPSNPDDKLSPIRPLHPHLHGQTNRVEIHDDGADSHIETTNKAVGPMVSPYGTL